MSGEVLRLSGVSVSRGGKNILGPLDWKVNLGERWVVIGPNEIGRAHV